MSMVLYKQEGNQVVFYVRVAPSAKRVSVGGVHDGCLKISVQAAPDKGKANEAVIASLADFFAVSRSEVAILSGHTGRKKQIRICSENPSAIIEFSVAVAEGRIRVGDTLPTADCNPDRSNYAHFRLGKLRNGNLLTRRLLFTVASLTKQSSKWQHLSAKTLFCNFWHQLNKALQL